MPEKLTDRKTEDDGKIIILIIIRYDCYAEHNMMLLSQEHFKSVSTALWFFFLFYKNCFHFFMWRPSWNIVQFLNFSMTDIIIIKAFNISLWDDLFLKQVSTFYDFLWLLDEFFLKYVHIYIGWSIFVPSLFVIHLAVFEEKTEVRGKKN